MLLLLLLFLACNDLLTPPLLKPSYSSLVSGPLTSFFCARDPYLFVLHFLAFAALLVGLHFQIRKTPTPSCLVVRSENPSYISRKSFPRCTAVSSCDSDTRLDRSCGLWRGCRGCTGVGVFWCRCCRLRGGCST
jgi:hypothetical protein